MRLIDSFYNQKIIKKSLSKVLFSLKNRPSVAPLISEHSKDKAIFMISADLELGWGWRYSKNGENPLEMAQRSRNNFPFLINIFENYHIPITWGVVGHLFLQSCNVNSHKWMMRIPYFENKNWVFNKGDWFDADPCTLWKSAKEWYAPDLIQKILDSKINHEIGSHTFSHIDLSYNICPPQVAEDEIKACIEAAKQWNINLKSFIFAGGTYGHYEILRRHGFTNYRKTLRHELAYPHIDEHGLIVIPASVSLEDNGLGWSVKYFKERYKKYIDKAIKYKALCHFWFHPTVDEWFLHEVFPFILQYVAELRDKKTLRIDTASNVAEYISCQLKSE